MTQHTMSKKTPVKLTRCESSSSSSSHTPDKEIAGVLSGISTSFNSIGLSHTSTSSSSSSSSGGLEYSPPPHMFKSSDSNPSFRCTPGAGVSAGEVRTNLTGAGAGSGAFEQQKMLKVAVYNEPLGGHFPTAWSPAVPQFLRTSHSHHHSQLQYPNSHQKSPRSQEISTLGLDFDDPKVWSDMYTSSDPGVHELHSPIPKSSGYGKVDHSSRNTGSPVNPNHNMNSKIFSFHQILASSPTVVSNKTSDYDNVCNNDEEPSPSSQRMTQYVHDLTTSPFPQMDDSSGDNRPDDGQMSTSEKQRLFEMNMTAAEKEPNAAFESSPPPGLWQEHHYQVSPGKNVNSAVFEPMSHTAQPLRQQHHHLQQHPQFHQPDNHSDHNSIRFPDGSSANGPPGFVQNSPDLLHIQHRSQPISQPDNHGCIPGVASHPSGTMGQLNLNLHHQQHLQPGRGPYTSGQEVGVHNRPVASGTYGTETGFYASQLAQPPHFPQHAQHGNFQNHHLYHQPQQSNHPIMTSEFHPPSSHLDRPPPLYAPVRSDPTRPDEVLQRHSHDQDLGNSRLINMVQFQSATDSGSNMWSSISSIGSDNSTVESGYNSIPINRSISPPLPPSAVGHGGGNVHQNKNYSSQPRRESNSSHQAQLAYPPSHRSHTFPQSMPLSHHSLPEREHGSRTGISVDQGIASKNFASAPAASSVAQQRRSKEDPTKFSRQDQVESASSRAAYKAFSKVFAQKEAVSVDDALQYASEAIITMPEDIKWRIYVDAGDLMKRHNRMSKARYLFSVLSSEFPQAHHGWMEWAKLEEEDGNFELSLEILDTGTRVCNGYNEVLLMRAIKQNEKLNNLNGSRALLGKLYNEPVEKIWRTVLEGALLEERAGNVAVARKLLCVLVHKVAWYGPIYYEAFRLEEKAELFSEAYLVIRKGLAELPRYGPLWFGLLRIMERTDIGMELLSWQRGDGVLPTLFNVRRECQNAIYSISRELVWKVHFEQAQIEERAATVVAQSQSVATNTPIEECLDALLDSARKCFVLSMMACPSNLRWKIFLAGARMELNAGKIDTVKALLRQAHMEVPEKSRYHVFLECCRLEEFTGSVDAARKILTIARSSIKNEWKIYLESVLVEARDGNLTTAIFIADEALRMDSGSGRLWALLLQLVHRIEWKQSIVKKLHCSTLSENSPKSSMNKYVQVPAGYTIPSKFNVLYRALQVVPKSGEVWCEGARVLLNPLSLDIFDPCQAFKFLSFAIMFTPQYGDSFVEYVRLEMLMQVILPRMLTLLGIPSAAFFGLLGTHDVESDFSGHLTSIDHPNSSPLVSKESIRSFLPKDKDTKKANMALAAGGELSLQISSWAYKEVNLERLYRRCLNADPNYGTAWFYYRERPIDTPGTIIDAVHTVLNHEMSLTEPVYVRAMMRYIVSVIRGATHVGGFDFPTWLKDLDKACPAFNTSIPNATMTNFDGMITLSPQDFVTGTVQLSRVMTTTGRTAATAERKEMLYGSDQITP